MNIEQYWDDVLRQRGYRLPEYFWNDAHIDWPCTNERFTVKEFIKVNCLYPGDWDGRVEKTIASGNRLITVAHVFSADHAASFHVTSFFALKEDRILSLEEYWTDDGPPPAWRVEMKVGKPIR